MQNLTTREKIANPITREWKLPERLESENLTEISVGPATAVAEGAGPLPSSPISLLGIAPALSPLAHLHGLSVHGQAPSRPEPSGRAFAQLQGEGESEEGRGKLGPHLKLLLRMVEDQPRAKIKDFYLTLKERGYSGSYDLVKKKIHSFRRELGRQAGALFGSVDAPHAQVEMAKILLKGPGAECKAHLFTMVLGHSGRYYAELIEGCDMGSFLQCHQNAFEFFGGVPAGVFYDPQESPTMRRLVGGFPFHLPIVDCGHHYGYTAQPTPSFAPWMKGRLKRPGKILKKLFFPGYVFTDLEKANGDMLEWMAVQAPQNAARERKEKSQREKLAALPVVGFNFRGRRQFLRLRA